MLRTLFSLGRMVGEHVGIPMPPPIGTGASAFGRARALIGAKDFVRDTHEAADEQGGDQLPSGGFELSNTTAPGLGVSLSAESLQPLGAAIPASPPAGDDARWVEVLSAFFGDG